MVMAAAHRHSFLMAVPYTQSCFVLFCFKKCRHARVCVKSSVCVRGVVVCAGAGEGLKVIHHQLWLLFSSRRRYVQSGTNESQHGTVKGEKDDTCAWVVGRQEKGSAIGCSTVHI